MGSLFRTEIIYTNLPTYLASCNKPVIGALLDGSNIWGNNQRLQLPQEGAILVIGNESRGISLPVQQYVTQRIAIPNLGGTAESLNASVACAILIAQLLQPSISN
jgi:TrmH family RNA methyltransferase